MRPSSFLKTSTLILCLAIPAAAAAFDVKKVDAILGRSPTQSGGVYRYGFPRSDLAVTLDGVRLEPTFALGGWIAFEDRDGKTAIMGDLVLTEAEVNPVLTKLVSGGVEVTALHNHLLRAAPATFYLHVGGAGDPEKIAQTIRAALSLTGTPLTPAAPRAGASAPLDFDTAKIDQALGAKGRANGGVYQFAVPRVDEVTENHMVVPVAMGVANVINFQPTGGGKAAVTGDFIALNTEVGPLVASLRSAGIEVTAIHNHMLTDNPRTFYVHFWANAAAVKLVESLRAALDKTNVQKRP